MNHGLVYRDSAVLRSQTELVDELLVELRTGDRVAGLLAASALETALADAADPLAHEVASITDTLARAFLEERELEAQPLEVRAQAWRSPRMLRASVPEGFAYYALSPRTFARSARAATSDRNVLVIGIRTIGTTLSALAMAALPSSERLTVRPSGDRYDRRLSFDELQREVIARHQSFLVADEGPGHSGSSFLSVAEALVTLGISPPRITLLGTRAFDPATLVAPDAERRARRFRFVIAGERAEPSGEDDFSGGKWQVALRAGLPDVPLWRMVERAKYLSPDCSVLRKFAGLGAYGRRVHRRAVDLADRGFTPAPLERPDEDGFIRHLFVPGRPPSKDHELASHLGRYIAARPRVTLRAADEVALELSLKEMVRVNVELEAGVPPLVLPNIERLVIADGKLMPYEWVIDDRGRALKTDATDHGDDHFFPGPTDSAWDLAGAIIEWQLDGTARSQMLDSYREQTGDDPSRRLQAFLVAYAAFRARACVMAELGSSPGDAVLWRHARSGYARALREALLPVRPKN